MRGSSDAPLAELAQQFLNEVRDGKHTQWEDYARAHPHLADRIESYFPLMQLLDGAASESALRSRGSSPSGMNMAPPPEDVGGYTILRRIGSGGMGIVFEAEQQTLGRRVALKVLPLDVDADPVQLERFRQESTIAASLDHPHVVKVHDVGEAECYLYYAMQLIDGYALDQVVRGLRSEQSSSGGEEGRSSSSLLSSNSRTQREYFRFVAQLGRDVADALQHAHHQGIVHRDIKPSNLLLDKSLAVYVADFGLAKLPDSQLTQSGDVLGTVRYMAPEQFRGWADPRSDVYSLGVTLYELLTQRPPHVSPDRVELIRKIAEEPAPPPRKIDPTIPTDLETIVLKSLAKEPASRYASAGELRDDLTRFLDNQPIRARRDSLLYRTRKAVRRHRTAVTAAVLVLLSLLTGLVVASVAWQKQTVIAEQNKKLADDNLQLLTQAQERLYLTGMQRAYEFHNQNKPEQVRAELAKVAPKEGERDWRGAEWHLLDEIYRQPTPLVLEGHVGPVNELATVPGKPWIVSVGSDSTIRIWHQGSGDLLHTMEGDGCEIHAVAVAPDGLSLAAATTADETSSTVYLWSLETMQPIRALLQVQNTVESLAFSPDQGSLAVGERNRYTWLVRIADGQLISRQETSARHEKLQFIENGNKLISTGNIPFANEPRGRNVIQLWDSKLKQLIHQWKDSPCRDFSISHSGRVMAASSQYYPWVNLFSIESRNRLHKRTLAGDCPRWTAFSPDDQTLVVGKMDGTIQLLDLPASYENEGPSQGEQRSDSELPLRFSIQAHAGVTPAGFFLGDGRLVSCGVEGLIKIWPVALPTPQWHGPLGVKGIALSQYPTDSEVALIDADGTVWTTPHLDCNEWTRVQKVSRGYGAYSYSYSPSGDFVAASLSDGGTEIVDRQETHQRFLRNGTATNSATAFSPDGQFLVTTSDDLKTRVWSTRNWKEILTIAHKENAHCLSISKKNILAIGGEFSAIELFDLQSEERIASLPVTQRTMALDWDDAGNQLLSSHGDGQMLVWSMDSPGKFHALGRHDRGIFLSAETPISYGNDRAIRLWHIPTGEPIGVLYQGLPGTLIHDLVVDHRRGRILAVINTETQPRCIACWPLPALTR